ncbi:MAG: ATP-binding cassette domain-containing protein [Bacteroidales bacterium]|nr:ATP-binding cassette domain-containing protein [Bacteroidales bacterium]
MSEPILMALVQLFAIVAAAGQQANRESTRTIISSFLKSHLNSQELEEYLKLFDELLFFHQPFEEGDELPDTAEKISEICLRVNKGLQLKDKVIVFIKFLEFLEDEHGRSPEGSIALTEEENRYLKIIGETFNLPEPLFCNCCAFILDPESQVPDRQNLLLIDAVSHPEDQKHMLRENLDGQILIQYLPQIHSFICRYTGKDEINFNGNNLIPFRAVILTHGSILTSLKISPVYYTDVAARFLHTRETIAIEYTGEEIEFHFKNSTNGIQPFSFTAGSGELIGVMGGSGVGKSTLLNLLNGNIPLTKGRILINGYDLQSDREQLRGIIGFVPQDDLLIEELTVFQNLYYNAKLCFSGFSRKQLLKAVMKILSDIGLAGIKHLKVGDPLNKFISGGQRKRLNIALELIREPSVLFADEPTSGLSSMDSEMVMLLLKEQTLKGRLVVVNIHQPSSDIFKLFDKLLILDKGGYPIYYGNPIDALKYFKTLSSHVNPNESECFNCGYVNPEQILQITEAKVINEYGKLGTNRKITPRDWYEHFTKNIQPGLKVETRKHELPKHHFQVPNLFKQFRIFGTRNLLSKITNTQYLLINLLEAPVLAALLAFLTRYYPSDTYIFGMNSNLVAYLFMSVVVSLFFGMMVSAEEIIHDQKILKREAFLHLSRWSYLNSKIALLFALSAIQAFSFVMVGNLILDIRGMLLSYFLILFATSCFANMVGLNISSGMKSVVAIYILIPFILVPQLLLSGTIVPFDNLNPMISSRIYVPFVGDLMTSRWSYEAMAVHQFKDNRYERLFYGYEKEMSYYSFISAYQIPTLQAELDACQRNLKLGREEKKTENYFDILNNEIPRLSQEAGFGPFNMLNDLTPERFTAEVKLSTSQYLDSLSRYFSSRLSSVTSHRDAYYEKLVRDIGQESLHKMRQEYYNQSLADFALNQNSVNKIIEANGKLIRKKDPIFMDPRSHFGRAHFYAPYKNLFGLHIDTLWFNFGVIWLMSIVLYFTLLHDTLRKVVEGMERVRFRKR